MSISFFDSNVLVYYFVDADSHKSEIAERLVQSAIVTRNALISYQVVQETINVICKKFVSEVTTEMLSEMINYTLEPLWEINPSPEIYQHALRLHARYKYSYYDSLMIAAALEAGCETLYSEDMQDGQTIEQLTIRNPFRN